MKKSEIYDFRAFGQAIKQARKNRKWTREQVAGAIHIAPRYLLSIENYGQHPSLQVFYELVTMFNISVDQFFYSGQQMAKTTQRRQIDSLLDEIDEDDLIIVEGTINGILKARERAKIPVQLLHINSNKKKIPRWDSILEKFCDTP